MLKKLHISPTINTLVVLKLLILNQHIHIRKFFRHMQTSCGKLSQRKLRNGLLPFFNKLTNKITYPLTELNTQ